MSDRASFSAMIEARLDTAAARRQRIAEAATRSLAVRDGDDARFVDVAEHIHEHVMRPRLAALVSFFPLASTEHGRQRGLRQSVATFAKTDRFPATAIVSLGVTHGADRHCARAFLGVDIAPALFVFERERQLDVALDAVDEAAVTTWSEEQLLWFLALYLRVSHDPAYRATAPVIDPVCEMMLPLAACTGSAVARQQTWRFCSARCQALFEADPDGYVTRRTGRRQP